MGLFSKKRYVVTTLMVGVDGDSTTPILGAVRSATQSIVDAGGDLDVAGAEMARVCEILLEYERAWSHVANLGQTFSREEDAGAYGEECFTNCAGRYLSSGAGSGERSSEPFRRSGRLVVMLTVAFQGAVSPLEKTIATHEELSAALAAIVALARQDRLDLVHIHFAPATAQEALTDDQLLANYPELLAL